MLRVRLLVAAVGALVACGGDPASAPDKPATLGSFDKSYGVLAGRVAGMAVRVTSSTGTAGFIRFAYDAAAETGSLSYVVCVAAPCPATDGAGAVTFTAPPLRLESRYDDQATFRTAPGAPTEVAVAGGRIRSGVPIDLTVDVLDPPKAHLEGAVYPFSREP